MSKTIATVNGEAIPQEAIDFELQRLVRYYAEQGMPEAQIRTQLPVLQERALEQAIGAKLLINEARKLDMPVSGDEIDAAYGRYVQQFGGDEAKLEEILKQQGMTKDGFKAELRQGRMVDKLVEKACEGIPMPTEEEITEHFTAHQGEYKTEDSVLAQHILIKPADATDEAKQAAKAKLEGIRADIIAGKPFGEAAKEFSDCPSGKSNEGSLGWFGHGMMVPEFDTIAFDLALESVSEVFETQFGWHIIYKTGEKKGNMPSLDEMHDQVKDFLFHVKRGEAVSAYVEELKSKADIKITQE